jgi:hypothetical protein
LRGFRDDALAPAMLAPFAEEIWIADGPTAEVAGFRYPTRMAVIRLTGGAIFIWSPIPLGAELRAEVEALGEVRFVIAPNSLHHLFLGDWRLAYPGARLYPPPGLRARRKDIAFDGDLGDAPPGEWAADVDQVVVRGNLITTEVVFFHRASRTVLFTDLIQHFRPAWFTGWRGVVARMDRMVGPEPQVPNKFRAAFVGRRAARAALRRILAWPAQRVLMAHAPPVEADGQAFIARAFGWLVR